MDIEGLTRRDFLRIAGAGAVAASGLSREAIGAAPAPLVRWRGRWPGYDDAVVVDALASPIQFNIPQNELPLAEAVLADVRASGITAVNLTVSVVGATAADPFERTVARIAGWEAEVERHPETFCRIRGADDVLRAKETGRLGLIYGFQDAVPLEGRLERLSLFHGLGVRVVQLTYNDRNRLGDGALEPADAGLSRLGTEAVERMSELGILVDVSHCGARTTAEAIRRSERPVAVTHSGCDALFSHPRNKSDETLRLLADRGGVFGVYLMPFLNPSGAPTAAHVVDHLEHALDVCGEDHVGIGSDQGIRPLDVGGDFRERFREVARRREAMGIAAPREDTPPFVPELNHPRRMDAIADRLSSRGHPDRVVEKVLGANWTRLFGEVWS